MNFSSVLFLSLFLPLVLFAYQLSRDSHKNAWLFFFSLLFSAWPSPAVLLPLCGQILICRGAGRLLTDRARGRGLIFFAGLTGSLALLLLFRYGGALHWLCERLFSFCVTLPDFGNLPGLSFFTLSGISLLADLYRKKGPAPKSLLETGLYIAFFPRLIAGPLVRFCAFARDLPPKAICREGFCEGAVRFIFGLCKKVLISEPLAVMADAVWESCPGPIPASIAWAGSIAFSLQIYFDFSGYSDMAIGLGRIFGFQFGENFDQPYRAGSLSAFWRRWHISLSDWFRDYVYIPLGGSRKHELRNLAAVFFLSALWHGPKAHFFAFGLWHGFFVCLEHLGRRLFPQNLGRQRPPLIRRFLTRLSVLLIVHAGWVLFRAPSLADALSYVRSMLGLHSPVSFGFSLVYYLDRLTLSAAGAALFLSFAPRERIADGIRKRLPEGIFFLLSYALALLLLFLCMVKIVSESYHPFIYQSF